MRFDVVAAFFTIAVLVCGQSAIAQAPALSERSLVTLERECAARQSESCDEISSRYRSGIRGVSQDDAKFAHYTKLTCEAGRARSCGIYAAYTQGGRSGFPHRDPVVAARFARLGCVGGDGLSCGLASAIANRSEGYTAAERAEIYEKVCGIGEAADCEKASYAEGQRQNWQSAARFAQKACSMGSQNACSNVPAYVSRYENVERARTAQADQAARAATRQDLQSAPQTSQPASSPTYEWQRRGATSGDRSGRESCSKSNGSSGQRYWYYGFDNQIVYGPCI